MSRKTSPPRRPSRRAAGDRGGDGEPQSAPPLNVRLQKVLAEHGLGSRREMERWIEAGRVLVNGAPAELGQRVTVEDEISIDGRPLRRQTDPSLKPRVLLYNKPVGEVCTRSDPEGRPTIFERLPSLRRGRWISVGRLDIATSGLLLLTNDGGLAHRLMHPSTGLDREYAVRVNGVLGDEQLASLLEGIEDDGEVLSFSDIRYFDGRGTNHWYHVALMEGRNREIRRLFEACGLVVSRLKRVRFGPVVLPSRIRRGHYEDLSRDDVRTLYRILGLPVPQAAGPARPDREKGRTALIPYPALSNRPGSSG